MAWHRYCDCKVWVEGAKCPGNDLADRVFVHQDDLPESTKVLKFLGECWLFNPSSDRKCLPKGVHRLRPTEDSWLDDCSACEEEEEETNGSPSGGGEPGGPAGDPPVGGWRGWYWEHISGPPPKGIKADICAAHASRAAANGVDVSKFYFWSGDELSDSRIVMAGGYCWQVPTGPVVEPSPGQYYISAGSDFDSCDDCTNGHLAELCPGDQLLDGADDAPDVYIRPRDMATCPDAFQRGKWCYAKPAGAAVLMPEGAIVWNPTEDELTCPDCGMGIPFNPCPGQPTTDKVYWTPAADAQVLIEAGCPDTIYQRIDGRCYYLLLTTTPARIPRDAIRIPPRRAFASCEDCLCDLMRDTCTDDGGAVPVHLCDGQDPNGWREAYMPASKMPSALTVFSYDGFCVYVDPTDARVMPPLDALLIYRIDNTYPSCDECFSSGGYNPGYEITFPPWPLPHPHPKTPREGEGPGVYPGGEFAGLRDCDPPYNMMPWHIDIGYIRYIRGDAAAAALTEGKVIALSPGGERHCYEIIRPWPPRGGCINAMMGHEVFDSCDECDPKCVRGNCTFDEDSTITGFSWHRWELYYSDLNCQTLNPISWLPYADFLWTVGTLEAQWTDEDLTNCGVWQGEGTHVDSWPGTEFPPEQKSMRLQLRYTSSNVWQYRVSYYDAEEEEWSSWGDWYNLYNPESEVTLNQSNCEGYSHSYDTGCRNFDFESWHAGNNCSFTVQNNPLP